MNRFNLKELGKLLMQETERVSDGYHTFSELYEFRKMYNALLFNEWYKQGKYQVHKSWKHNVETHSEDYNLIGFEEQILFDVHVMLEEIVFVKNQDLKDEFGIYKNFVLRTAIPTWEQVLEWFIEKNLIGKIEYGKFNEKDPYYAYCITNKMAKVIDYSTDRTSYKSYREAREALVNKLIELYEKK